MPFPVRQRRHPMTRRTWFAAVTERLDHSLPDQLASYTPVASGVLLKIVYTNPRIHYEVWPDTARGHIEVALHFEDGPASTLAYLRWFDRRIVALKHELGVTVELERWTSSWGRIYELHPLVPFDDESAGRIAGRLAALIVALQPLVEEAAIPPGRDR
jgi:hypothetical protein